VYFCIGLAAFWSRISQRDEPRPYRMPLWPLPPIVVVGFTGVALATQGRVYLIAELILAAIAVALWALSKIWSRGGMPGEHPAEEEAQPKGRV
jgi:amino acid transporter